MQMFSRGNITEKIRVATLPCEGETVVDLFAGIGYFTLPYLIHAGAAFLHACEWNPHAAAALRINLRENNVGLSRLLHDGGPQTECGLSRTNCPKYMSPDVSVVFCWCGPSCPGTMVRGHRRSPTVALCTKATTECSPRWAWRTGSI